MSKNTHKFVDLDEDDFGKRNLDKKKDRRQLRKKAKEQQDFISQNCMNFEEDDTIEEDDTKN